MARNYVTLVRCSSLLFLLTYLWRSCLFSPADRVRFAFSATTYGAYQSEELLVGLPLLKHRDELLPVVLLLPIGVGDDERRHERKQNEGNELDAVRYQEALDGVLVFERKGSHLALVIAAPTEPSDVAGERGDRGAQSSLPVQSHQSHAKDAPHRRHEHRYPGRDILRKRGGRRTKRDKTKNEK